MFNGCWEFWSAMKQIFECDKYRMPPIPSGQPTPPTFNSIPPATSWANMSIVTKSAISRTPLNQLNVNSDLEGTLSFSNTPLYKDRKRYYSGERFFKTSKPKISKEKRCNTIYTRKTLTFIGKVLNEEKAQDHERIDVI